MVQLVTKGIKISVQTHHEGAFYKSEQLHFAFTYTITIENLSPDTVQLQSRHWVIFDALKQPEIVTGPGVIGEQPILASGDSFTYTSGCLTQSPLGAMKGFYNMINTSTLEPVKVYIPYFNLSAPFILN